MIVTASLIWWNERPDDLERCVRGMASIADRVVAVDGSYRRYPAATVSSSLEQIETIKRTAFLAGLGCEVIVPDRLWAGQVEKRAFALAKAAEGSDWVAVFDADWRASGDREAARAELAGLTDDVVSVPFYTPPGNGQVASGWHKVVRDTLVPMPHLFRALPELTVERYHWHISALKDRNRVWLWGLPEGRPLMRPHELQAPYRIEHMTLHRTPEQVLASRAFLNDRLMVVALTDQEDDVPGLPEPQFDYDTIPLVDLRAERHARRRARQLRKRHYTR